MAIRALLAFLACPGMAAIAIPITWLVISSHTEVVQPLGMIPLTIGFLALLWCVRDFYVSGRGTLAPWAPPVRLVVVGLYRYTRNPMYIAVALVLIGWASSFGSMVLFIYAIVVVVMFHLRVIFGEEPFLDRTYGKEWEEYTQRVPRWLWNHNARRRA